MIFWRMPLLALLIVVAVIAGMFYLFAGSVPSVLGWICLAFGVIAILVARFAVAKRQRTAAVFALERPGAW